MFDNVQQIKDKLDILEYIKTIVSLRQSGKNWKGVCPFHEEKTPSFMINPERQIWHCFGGCNAGGDIFSFVMKYENVEFYESLKILAEKAGVDLQKTGGGDWQKYNRLYEINEAAKDFFIRNLTRDSSAYTYLRERGLNSETIEEFEIGLAINNSDSLLRHLIQTSFSVEDMERAGIIFRSERGTYWDRFRNRLMFPLYNISGKVIGFTGRVLELTAIEQLANKQLLNSQFPVAKYVNSPETSIFQKSKFLYGLHKTKNFIREKKTAVLVEGQMDFLMSWQDGLKNVVATSGTALTANQLNLLKRASAEQLILSFDSDTAGQNAIERSIDLAAAQDFLIKVLVVTNAKDPAEVVRSQPGMMIQLADKAVLAMDYYFKHYLNSSVLTPGGIFQKKKNLRLILSKIKGIGSAIERSSWLKELAVKSGIEENILLEEMAILERPEMRDQRLVRLQSDSGRGQRKDLITQRVFSIVYHNPQFIERIEPLKKFFPAVYQDLFDYFLNKKELSEENLPDNLKKKIDLISLQGNGNQIELENLLNQLKLEFYKHKQKAIRLALRRAEVGNNEVVLGEIIKEFDIISRELHTINTYDHQKEKQKENNDKEEDGVANQEDWSDF